ncbi:MAG: hypothetical protein HY908_09315 [Myxococcales bacterium]|nr:hypothetical protein [Myxococcales bacterium]
MTLRSALGMTLFGLAVSTAGCGDKGPPPACKAFATTIGKVEGCASFPESQRSMLKAQRERMDELMKRLESMPSDALKEVGDMCAQQDTAIREAFAKLAPDCMK